ncbi:MAG: REP-associated tyrosine transposase [Terriglobia bacterium]
MSRVQRLLVTDRIFFVTVSLRRALTPLKAGEYRLVAAAIDESRGKLGFLLCGYVLMPDHWHALIWTAYPLTISRVVQDIKWISARCLNDKRSASGPVWQHQFWNRFVRHEKEFVARFHYMHLNPVRKGLVSKPEEWRWSSYNNFALDKETLRRCPTRIDYLRLPERYRG